ncbi:MAG TPA: alpha/beta fold hydrolase [Longimicrobiales bacterium]|nr:alpha/beta fold hydrolase [Longimicrobiales bacterium]
MRRRTSLILMIPLVLACAAVARSGTAFPLPAAVFADPRMPRPQEPLRPLPYGEHQVTFVSPGAGVRLAGTLTLPAGRGPHPAVVLVAGTGPQDRDASVAGHRPFLVLADHLTRRGVAVLRFDERGVGRSGGQHATASTPDFAADVAAAVEWLARRRDIDTRRIGLIGHSEGGMVAPLVAARSVHVSHLVLLAAPGLPMRDVGVQQVEAMGRAEGDAEVDIAARVRMSTALLDLFGRDLPPDVFRAQARPLLARGLAGAMLPPPVLDREIERALLYYESPWARFALRYDPAPALRNVHVPVLALNGGLDTQVRAESNLPAIAAALRAGGNRDVTVRLLPGLNHYFQPARTGGPGEYARIAETFAPAALALIGDWVTGR